MKNFFVSIAIVLTLAGCAVNNQKYVGSEATAIQSSNVPSNAGKILFTSGIYIPAIEGDERSHFQPAALYINDQYIGAVSASDVLAFYVKPGTYKVNWHISFDSKKSSIQSAVTEIKVVGGETVWLRGDYAEKGAGMMGAMFGIIGALLAQEPATAVEVMADYKAMDKNIYVKPSNCPATICE